MQAPRETFKALFAKDLSASWRLTEPLLRTDAYREVFEAVHSTGRWIRESGEEDDIPSDLQTNIEDPVPDSLGGTPADHLEEGFTADPADRDPFASPSPVPRDSSSLPSHSSTSRRRGAVRGTRVALDSEGLTNAANALVTDSVEHTRADIRAAASIVRTLDGLTQAQRFRASSQIISDPIQALRFLEKLEETQVDYLLDFLGAIRWSTPSRASPFTRQPLHAPAPSRASCFNRVSRSPKPTERRISQ